MRKETVITTFGYYYYIACSFIVVNQLKGTLTKTCLNHYNATGGRKYSLFNPPDIFFHFLSSIAGHAIEGSEFVDTGSADCSHRAVVFH